jgi:predicted lysophospholipase L1 biosynthesis ABC-type transport system permease subunit
MWCWLVSLRQWRYCLPLRASQAPLPTPRAGENTRWGFGWLANRSAILLLIVRQLAACVIVGIALGVAGSLVLTRFVASQLYGVTPTDPLTFVSVSAILVSVALLACYIPARRATKVVPMAALRHE